jgi:hypothetical protein
MFVQARAMIMPTLKLEASIRAGIQALWAHFLALAIDGLNRMAVVSKLKLIDKPVVWLHIGASHWDETHAGLCQDAGLVISTIVGLVGKQPCALWQHDR